jgi:CheY-like chemotaxis protein
LSNAAKFTDHGRVLIAVEGGDESCPVAISVQDTGIGIPPGKEEIIFDAFQQADGSTRRRYGGTGLGLSISRELARLLGGQIEVSSTQGEGSCFTLRLPLSRDPRDLEAVEIIERLDKREPAQVRRPPRASEADSETGEETPTPPPGAFGDQWVLLVERDVQSLVDVTAQLESMGLRVQTAANGEEALETLSEEGDCALLLLAAPASPQETCDTIQSIRQDAGFDTLPIAIIGAVDTAQQQRCREAGACGFLGKPIDRQALMSLLESALKPTEAATAKAQTSRESPETASA